MDKIACLNTVKFHNYVPYSTHNQCQLLRAIRYICKTLAVEI